MAGESSMHTLKITGREGRAQENTVADKGMLPCVGCVGIVDARTNRSCGGVPSSVNELTSLAILLFHFLQLDKPKRRLAWLTT